MKRCDKCGDDIDDGRLGKVRFTLSRNGKIYADCDVQVCAPCAAMIVTYATVALDASRPSEKLET
jgi:hypothetical protein